MRKFFTILTLIFLLCFASCKKTALTASEKTPNLNFSKVWSKVNGGSSYDHFWSGTGTLDGGYIAVGYTASNDGDISGLKGQTDALVVKYDVSGNRSWQVLIGGSDQDYATSICQLPDGSFVGGGYSKSNDGDITTNHGGRDGILFKLSGSGAVQWVKAIGSAANEAARSMLLNPDGTFTLAGYRADAADATVSFDAWICKLDQNGNLLWEKTFGGSSLDNAASIIGDGDGGYLFTGYSSSSDGDASGKTNASSDYWLIKIDGTGNKLWHKTYGGTGVDWAHDIVKTTNGYVLNGRSSSSDGDVTGQHGGSDAWIIKVDNSGNKVWQQALGGTQNDSGQGLLPTADGGLFIGVNAQSTTGSFSSQYGYMDAWVVKLDENGVNLGQKVLGGSGSDEIFGFAGNSNSYSILGSTSSSDGDLIGYQVDFTRNGWILKFEDQ